MLAQAPYDLTPLLYLLGLGAALALLPLAWLALRQRSASNGARQFALAMLITFLTMDLILLGAFTRLSDSGLGCPDWPGCYGHASPLGASQHIELQQASMPTGPVTHGKAWVEMLHRYLASALGALIICQFLLAWFSRVRAGTQHAAPPLIWPFLTLIWVCVQGAFGALTVTMKLFPAIVSLHLLGSYILLALLVIQVAQWQRHLGSVSQYPEQTALAVSVPARVLIAIGSVLLLVLLQACSGAWVSTNYAVLSCPDFPKCQGSWWPAMDFVSGFETWRPLGMRTDGSVLDFQALTAIHFSHRMLAVVTSLALLSLWRMLRTQVHLRKARHMLGALLLLQVLTGMGNVVLEWPIAGAMLHTLGAGSLVGILVWMLAWSSPERARLAAVQGIELNIT